MNQMEVLISQERQMNLIKSRESIQVLVIEDSPDDRELYRRLLKKRNDIHFEIYETDNVEEALKICREKDLDCVIVDYQLPGADGIDFIHSYKEQHADSGAALVMVTGQGNETTAVEALKLGALDYVPKSSIPEGFFVQNILNAIERAQLALELTHSNKKAERFAYIATHDPLTDLANRRAFMDNLSTRSSAVGQPHSYAVIYLDLDGFKQVNDRFGHDMGDHFLKIVADILRQCIRPDDMAARFGGDEFTILLEKIKIPDDAIAFAERVLEAMPSSFGDKNQQVAVGVSMGIAMGSADRFRSPEDILHSADQALYQAKIEGKGRYKLVTD